MNPYDYPYRHRCIFCGNTRAGSGICTECRHNPEVRAALATTDAPYDTSMSIWRGAHKIWLENLGMRRYLPIFSFMDEPGWEEYVEAMTGL